MRLGLAVPALALSLAGCDRILGLDDIPIDQGALTVHGSYTTRRALNSATRLPLFADDPPAGHPPPSTFVSLDDGSRVLIVWNADDTFYFDRQQLAQAYRIVIPGAYPDPTVEYQLTGATPHLIDRRWGRPAAQRATANAGTSVQYTFASPPVSPFAGVLFLDSTGLWTQTVIGAVAGAPPAGESFTLDWAGAQAVPEAQPVALLDTIHDDRLYYVLYATTGTTSLLSHYRFDDVTMKDAAMTSIANQQLFAVQPDTCVLVDAPRAQEIQRITAAGYVVAGPATASWRLLAIPVLPMGPSVSFPLAFDTGTTDFGPTPVNFGSPFAGYDLALHMQATAPHAVLAPGATVPAVVDNGSDQYILPQATAASTLGECSMQQSSAFEAVQLPLAPLLDGFPLARDQPIQLDRTRLAKLTWTTSQEGAIPELYRARLLEVTADPSLVTQLAARAIWFTTNHTLEGSPQVLVDPALLESGKTYVLEIADILGQPGAATGELISLHYPYSIGFSYSGLLQVTN